MRPDGASYAEIILGRGKSKCKGCEAGVCLVWSNKEASVTGGQWADGGEDSGRGCQRVGSLQADAGQLICSKPD